MQKKIFSKRLFFLMTIFLFEHSLEAKIVQVKNILPYNLHLKHKKNQLILKYKKGFKSESLSVLSQLGAKIEHKFSSNGALLLSFPPFLNKSLREIADLLKTQGFVEYIEANTIIQALDFIPDDPKFSKTWGLSNDGSSGGSVGADIDALKAWEISTGSKDILLAVIDTGLDYNHPDLQDNIWTNPGESGLDAEGRDKRSNGLDDDHNNFIDDWHGWDFVNNDNDPMDDNRHGTHCAGTIGAVGNNGLGVAGVNWQVSLMGLKFLSGSGSGSLADAVKAINYATQMGVKLTSNSWGGGGFSETMKAAILRANEAGVLFVAAAGNSSINNDDSPHYPSNYQVENVISVAATDHKDLIAGFSNRGFMSVHLAAPGVRIFSTVPGGGYENLSGTSMATPHVAGAIALIYSQYPEMNHLKLKQRLLATVDRLVSLKTQVATGGRLNVLNALEDDSIPPGRVTDLKIESSSLTSLRLSFSRTGDDGSEGDASEYFARYAKEAINTEEDWDAAKRLELSLLSESSMRLEGFQMEASGFITLRARDNVANLGDLSESLSFSLPKPIVFYANDASSLDEVSVTGDWGLELNKEKEEIKEDFFFSDSPKGVYKNNQNSELLITIEDLPGKNWDLVFKTRYSLENRYDFAFLEVSYDQGGTWHELAKFNGQKLEWQTLRYSLLRPDEDKEPLESLRLRFRLKTDYSITKEGWWIDDIKILGPQKPQENKLRLSYQNAF